MSSNNCKILPTQNTSSYVIVSMSSNFNTSTANNTRRPTSILSAEDYPGGSVRSHSSSPSEVSIGRTASGSSKSGGGFLNSSRMVNNNKISTSLSKQHPLTITSPTNGSNINSNSARVDADSNASKDAIEMIITNSNNESAESTSEEQTPTTGATTMAFVDKGQTDHQQQTHEQLRRSISDSSKQPLVEELDSSTESKSSSASSSKMPAAKYGEQGNISAVPSSNPSVITSKPAALLNGTNHAAAVAFDPSTNEFTYLITVPRQLVDIHNVASVVRTTGESARLKHLLQYVADRYAPLPPPAVSSATLNHHGLQQQQPIPLLYASNNACVQHASNITVEIALSEAAIIDKSIYAAHERRNTQGTQQQQVGNNNFGRI